MLPRLMRWKPTEPACAECGFAWDIDPGDAIRAVETLPGRLRLVEEQLERSTAVTPQGWSARGYLWHLVDGYRINHERLLIVGLDPDTELVCWDENALASVRKYERLSVLVGLEELVAAVSRWATSARRTPGDATTHHPELGEISATDLVRRASHEAVHHELDIRRLLAAEPKSL